MGIEVGVDVGGTFTDAAVAADGEVVRAKAYSTRDVTGGILDVALARASAARARRGRVLRRDRQVRPGQHDRHQRDRRAALPAGRAAHDRRLQGHAADRPLGARPVPRRASATPRRRSSSAAIASSRWPSASTSDGDVLREADPDELRARRSSGCSSGRRGDRRLLPVVVQERRSTSRRSAAVVRELAPELPLTLSCELAPVYREYERMVTTVLDAACKPVVATHFDELQTALRRARPASRGEADAGRRRLRLGR